ncbi:LytTR family DNA-binding domain-containing protein [Chitinophaga sp. Cy-1792]|uniref:LytR/AlgR family response regulator transcription factor n=1 Tax=Chitinophaga sp. Cy-1792 TaxID=2608339 RepID=UPI00142041CB|nr:LytTR family DNA-binding domain-containing protein [Chitinophaga sp. Cy-1792]NIG52994.1 response regulator transcription factor [Chitinophaga sp. Cy-1792]
MKVRCLLVDDEPLAIRLLQQHIQQLADFEVTATCHNVARANEILCSTAIDLLFLDIRMPQVSGISFLKTLRNPPKTILTTAYREFAMDAYDLGVIDYLLKPISFGRFMKAIERYNSLHIPVTTPPPAVSAEKPHLIIKSGVKHIKLYTAEICYLESIKDYIKIYTTDKEIIAKYKISDMETALNDKGFLRIHRSFIININKITAFTNTDIELGSIELPIGANYREYIRKAMMTDNHLLK